MRTRFVRTVVVLGSVAVLSAVPAGQAPNQASLVTQTVAGVQFSTLPGFSIERVNPPDKNDSYVVVTFDSQGRLVVSKEQDHPRILLDNDKDGIYEAEKILSDKVRNCQGLWFDGTTMWGSCVLVEAAAELAKAQPPTGRGGGGGGGGNRPAAIVRLQDTNGDDVMDTMETLAIAGSIQEHGPHAIRRRPDGGVGLMMGNNEAIEDKSLELESPVLKDKDVQFLPHFPNWVNSARDGVHSGVYEWNVEARKFRVFSGGNRNSYDYAYNLTGEAFLFDSDMEWDIGLPWYREVRTVHQILNGTYGYRNASGKYPPYYIDSLPPVRDVGRGSPVGVEFYTSYAYPKEFFDNLFEADWSRGRLLYTALTPAGATFTARTDRAEFVHGEPFNITDVEVGPDGLMYFTTGGRNTTGGLWRLRYKGTGAATPDMTGILAVVRQAQPLSSWGWAAIEKVKATMGASFGAELEKVARNAGGAGITTMDRVRAALEMQRHGAKPSAALVGDLAKDKSPEVRAAAVYIAGAQGEAAKAIAAAALKDADPVVRRRSAEALVRMGQSPAKPSLAPVADIYGLLNDSDRFVRWAGRHAIEHTARNEWKDRVLKETNPLGALEGTLAYARTANGDSLEPLVEKQLAMLKQTNLSADNKLRLYRTLMYTAAETKGGLTAPQKQQLNAAIIGQFPSTDERINRELALMLGYAGQPNAIGKILAAVPKGNDKQELQLHYLYALRMIKPGWTVEEKTQLAELLGRASKWRGGAQFVNFVGQFFDSVADLYATDAEKQLLYEKAPDFSPLTPQELADIQARQAAAAAAGRGGRGAGGGGGGRGGSAAPLATRTAGRVLSRQEMFEETVYQPQQVLDTAEGRKVFEASCASCHRFGSVGNDHGVASLNLSKSSLRASKHAMLEAVFFPDRKIAPEQEASVIETTDGKSITGLLLKENAQSISLLTGAGTATDVQKSQIKSRRKTKATVMPDTLWESIDRGEMRNLAAFLAAQPPQ